MGRPVERWATKVRAWWATTRVMAWWRQLRGRPRQVTFVDAGTAHGSLRAHGVTASTGRATLGAAPSLLLEDQVEELRQRVNQPGEQLASEKQ